MRENKVCIDKLDNTSVKEFITASSFRLNINVVRFERVNGTIEAIANIFKKTNDIGLVNNIIKIFNKHGGLFYASWEKEEKVNYKAYINVKRMPVNVCKKILLVSKSINNRVKEINRINEKRKERESINILNRYR